MLPDCHEISLRIREELKNGKISDKCQITSYPLPPQPNNDMDLVLVGIWSAFYIGLLLAA